MESSSPRKMGDNFIGPWGDLKFSPAPALLGKWGGGGGRGGPPYWPQIYLSLPYQEKSPQ